MARQWVWFAAAWALAAFPSVLLGFLTVEALTNGQWARMIVCLAGWWCSLITVVTTWDHMQWEEPDD